MKRVLVTGHRGFVGRHIWQTLERAGGHELWGCEVTKDWRQAWRLFTDPHAPRFDLVIHCAALVDGRETIDGKAALLGAYNLQLDGALFEWALRARPGRIVYFSSSAAYPTSLQTLTRPRSLELTGRRLRESQVSYTNGGTPDATYGWVKLTGERIADEVRAAGVPVTVVRPFSGYGEDQDDCYPFPAMIARAARRDNPFVVWGDGQQVRDFIHVDDVVNATLTLAELGVDGPVNLGTGRGSSMDQLAAMCMDAAGYHAPIDHRIDKPVGVSYRVADPTLLHNFYRPRVSLEDGINRALAALAPAAVTP